jgi:hypothetical protein
MIFQWEFYLNKYDDLKISGMTTEEEALKHWFNHGKKELRMYNDIPILFNWKNYIESHDDLNRITNEEEAWKHFLYFGGKENRIIQHRNVLKIYCYLHP